MTENKLGTTPSTTLLRDAIHVAMIAVEYGGDDPANPGDKIKFLQGKAYVTYNALDFDGIVDPFLVEPIHHSQLFWLCLKPGSITSLVHHWQHPKFPSTVIAPEATQVAPSANELGESVAWVTHYAKIHCPYYPSADAAYEGFMDGIRQGEIHYYGRDCHHRGDVEDFDELCKHLSVILGQRIDQKYFTVFSCSC